MRLFTLLLSITVTGLTTSANAEALKEKWEGYKPVASADLPPKVKEFAENSVFLMESVSTLPGEKMEIVDLENDYRAKTKVSDRNLLTTDNFYFQIETCRKQKLRYCPIASTRISGTMFFNNNKFYTCRHNFQNWLSIAAEANDKLVSDISPPLILALPKKDKPGAIRVVYQSAFEDKKLMEFNFINDNINLNVQLDKGSPSYAANASLVDKVDFVEMSLPSGKSKSIVDSYLPIKNLSSSDKDEEIYTFGYPGKTNYASLGENNSPGGNQLSVTHGYLKNYNKEKILFTGSNFGSSGMSGGPVVNNEGKIVGMTCSGQNDQQAGSRPQIVNTAFFPLDASLVEDFWISSGLSYNENEESTQTSN